MTKDELAQQRREQTRLDIEADAQRWADSLGSRLDSRSLPIDLEAAAQPDEPVAAYDKHGFPQFDQRGLGLNSLKKFVNDVTSGNLDDATIQHIADETKDPALVHEALDRKGERESETFTKANPDYHICDENYQLIVEELSRIAGMPDMFEDRAALAAANEALVRAGYWTAPYLQQAFENLKHSGGLTFAPGSFKPLSEREKHVVRTKIALGSVADAIVHYLAFGKGEHPDMLSLANPHSFLHDESNLPLIRECIAFVFAELHPEFEPTPERVDWLLQWMGNRFPTLKLAEDGWHHLQQLEQQEAARVERHHLVYGDAEESEQQESANLDDLSDSEISSLYQRTARHIAKRGKAPGIII